ncbi:MAG: hypothetical protein WCB03_21965 [Rouxiella badensis]|uniref:hypothetical protein n=1 Tax=Rouxiella badensis TaxID=1646377 RepID=UPI003C41C46B
MPSNNHKLEPLPFKDFQVKVRRLFKRSENIASRRFNAGNDDFKFVILTLSNRRHPRLFSPSDIGKPFEAFSEHQREAIIGSMNSLSKWGHALPDYISASDRIIDI